MKAENVSVEKVIFFSRAKYKCTVVLLALKMLMAKILNLDRVTAA
jgi:hypothetical protein